jgi:hypothetical protein
MQVRTDDSSQGVPFRVALVWNDQVSEDLIDEVFP